MKLHLSGIQPSGRFHLGNYLGCIKPFLSLQHIHPPERKNIFLIADLHCFTKPENCSSLRSNVIEAVRSLLALGVDPKHVDIVQQSSILEHTNLAWILSCLTKFSRAENMTQFKANKAKFPNVGIFTYPILQAADILLYRPDCVLVGPDQKQHLELVAELCHKLDFLCGPTGIFSPVPIISNLRVMNLNDECAKMSKSIPGSCIFLSDAPETIHKKVLGAKTDSIEGISYDERSRKPLSNLIRIYGALADQPPELVIKEIHQLTHKQFKELLVVKMSETFRDFRSNYENISANDCRDVLLRSKHNVQEVAASTFSAVANKVGFI